MRDSAETVFANHEFFVVGLIYLEFDQNGNWLVHTIMELDWLLPCFTEF